jgi:hypothetical protein
MMIFYFTFDKIGIIFHPENSSMFNCRMEWTYRGTVDHEYLRLILFFFFTVIMEYLILYLAWRCYKIKRINFYKNLEFRVIFVSGCAIFAVMHFVFQFTFVFM